MVDHTFNQFGVKHCGFQFLEMKFVQGYQSSIYEHTYRSNTLK